MRSRIFKIYGYCGRRSPGQSESSDNYLPNISYMSFGTLEELGLIKKNKEKNTYGLNTLSLTYSGEYLLKELDKFIGQKDDTPTPKVMNINPNPNKNIDRYLTALRTKPFMLLAGISGTGKSRIVRKLAQASVSESLQREFDPKSVANGFNRWELHKPANFELIQVKPNWHNSLEVVGYKSNIGGAHYEFTPIQRLNNNPTTLQLVKESARYFLYCSNCGMELHWQRKPKNWSDYTSGKYKCGKCGGRLEFDIT